MVRCYRLHNAIHIVGTLCSSFGKCFTENGCNRWLTSLSTQSRAWGLCNWFLWKSWPTRHQTSCCRSRLTTPSHFKFPFLQSAWQNGRSLSHVNWRNFGSLIFWRLVWLWGLPQQFLSSCPGSVEVHEGTQHQQLWHGSGYARWVLGTTATRATSSAEQTLRWWVGLASQHLGVWCCDYLIWLSLLEKIQHSDFACKSLWRHSFLKQHVIGFELTEALSS